MSEIHMGDLFPTFAHFEAKLQLYKEAKCVDFFISDSRSLESARQRCPKLIEKVPEEVKYYYLRLKCVHGGIYKKRKGNKGMRESSTLKQDCKAFIYLKVDESSCNLIVSNMMDIHSHPVSRALYNQLPRQKRLSPESKQEVCELLQLQANKKMVQEKVLQTSGIRLTLRDLSNIAAKGRNTNVCNNLVDVVEQLKSKYKCTVQLMTDAADNFLGIYIQDGRMKRVYDAYPQFLCADSTYKLLDIRAPVFILMAEDGNGQSEVVAIGLLVHEDKQSLKWFFETFRSENMTSANDTIVIMTDKDLTERAVIKEIFPDSYQRICLFHILRSFNREVTCQKMSITPSHRDLVKDIFQKLCYCTTLEKYEEMCNTLKNTAEKPVWDYFEKNWNNIKDEWSSISSCNIGTYLNTTNNRLESFNSKLKSVCTHFSSLETFVTNLFIVLNSLRTERDNSSSKAFLKIPSKPLQSAEEEAFFQKLTPYAFSYVKDQLRESEHVNIENVTHEVTELTCNCKFMYSMCLPCKHIFSFRKNKNLSLFDENMYNKRWTREYFYSYMNMLNDNGAISSPSITNITVIQQNPRVLSTQQKFKKAVSITSKLASISAEQSADKFEKRMEFLEKIYRLWSEGKDLAVVEITDPCLQTSFEVIPEEGTVTDNVEEISPVPEKVKETPTFNGIKKIVMPTKVQVRGRPKGLTLTAIGLRRKKALKLVPFERKTCIEKRDILLSWFFDDETIDKIKKYDYLVEEKDVECRPERITSAIFNESVDINLIRDVFSINGWNALQSVIEIKKRNHIIVCPLCSKDIGAESTIICSLCLLTHHSSCVGLKITGRRKKWFCCSCNNVSM